MTAIVSTYKAQRFIRACLEDLEAQTIAGQLEIIVVDSGSPENEEGIVEEFQKRHSNILYLRTERETLYASWNRALKIARGRYVVNANCDDGRRRDAFEKLTSALETHPEADLAYADCGWTAEPNGRFDQTPILRHVRYPDYHPAITLFYCITGCLQFWRRSVFEKIGPFNGELKAAGDYELLFRFALAKGKAVRVPEPLSLFYQNQSGITQNSAMAAGEENAVRQKCRSNLPIECLFAVDPADRRAAADAWTALGCLAVTLQVPWHDAPLLDTSYASDCFKRALESFPQHAPALYNFGLLLKTAGHHAELAQLLDSLEAREKTEIQAAIQSPTARYLNVGPPPAVAPLVRNDHTESLPELAGAPR